MFAKNLKLQVSMSQCLKRIEACLIKHDLSEVFYFKHYSRSRMEVK